MRSFSRLYATLDETTSTLAKRAALAQYFRTASPADAAWAVQLLRGGKLPRLMGAAALRELASEVTGFPSWLVAESHAQVGDLAECLTLLVESVAETHDADVDEVPLSQWIERIRAMTSADDEVRRVWLADAWRRLPQAERFVLNKLLTGALRVGVSARMVALALADASGVAVERITRRLGGKWLPGAEAFMALISTLEDSGEDSAATPYPFYLASPLEGDPATLGDAEDWLAEWKWDGIRAQLLRRGGRSLIWSRGGEDLEGRFPEIEAAAMSLPDNCVLDGEILAWSESMPLPFIRLQPRINRLKPGANLVTSTPTRLLAYDLLEGGGRDLRQHSLSERRAALENMIASIPGNAAIGLSEQVRFRNWAELGAHRSLARERNVEGLMIKRLDSVYRDGRKRGDWWKWKVEPLTIDAVLIYAQSGHGRRAGLHTDYTFALWQGDGLVPFAKAYSGLTDAELLELDRWIRTHTIERFGPVRSVQPSLVFELAFEAVQLSKRHRSGVAVRFPRILRWRRDKNPQEADSLDNLRTLAGLAVGD